MAEEKKGVEGVIETLEEQLQKRERFLEYGSWTSVNSSISSSWTLKTIRISKEGAYVAETLTVTFRHRTKEDARKRCRSCVSAKQRECRKKTYREKFSGTKATRMKETKGC